MPVTMATNMNGSFIENVDAAQPLVPQTASPITPSAMIPDRALDRNGQLQPWVTESARVRPMAVIRVAHTSLQSLMSFHLRAEPRAQLRSGPVLFDPPAQGRSAQPGVGKALIT